MDKNSPASARLLTQNLIVSAIAAERSRDGVSWRAVQDLSALIDAYCLFDEGRVLGRAINVHVGYRNSELAELLKPFLTADYLASDLAAEVRQAAAARLRAYVGSTTQQQALKYFRTLDPEQVRNELQYVPDSEDEFSAGSDWIRSEAVGDPTSAEATQDMLVERATNYFTRTFLYIAYADISRLSLTIDSGRTQVVQQAVNAEYDLAARLTETLRKVYGKSGTEKFRDVRRRVSPLGAVVLQRAADNQSGLAVELDKLRGELSDARTRLREAEYLMTYGSDDDDRRGLKKWDAVFHEIERSYGKEPDIVSVRQFIHYFEAVGKTADDPKSVEAWAKSLLALPADVISRMIGRWPVLEIHWLRRAVPAGGRLLKAIEKLFGRVSQ
jgi:hypothetical protein